MLVLPDGRGKLNIPEINAKIWLKMGDLWTMEPDGVHFKFNFPSCILRALKEKCKPCGLKSKLGHYCELKDSMISVSYCRKCNERVAEKVNDTSNKISLPVSRGTSNLLGSESADT